ncbi:MAG: hypothetical protein AAGH17_03140 [Pseudomonadota bacterium]
MAADHLRESYAASGVEDDVMATHYPDSMQLYAATLENPVEFVPTFHVNHDSKLPWLRLTDDLETFEGTLLHAPRTPQD